MIKILAIGDPHGNIEELKKIDYDNIDIILLTGDTGDARLIREMSYVNIDLMKKGLPEIIYSEERQKEAFMQVYNTSMEVIKFLSKKAPVYLIFGNVELSNVKTEEEARNKGKKIPFLENDLNKIDNVHVINGQVVEFNGVKIGGLKYFIDSNWIEKFKSKGDEDYEDRMNNAIKDTTEAKDTLDKFREIDILICHQPPLGYLDVVTNPKAPKHWQGLHAGSKTILEYVKKENPKYVICGHIHEGKGEANLGESKIYNLGVCGWKIIEID